MRAAFLHITLTVCAVILGGTRMAAQNDAIVGQYIHNRFAINPAFAGCRSGVSVFGSFRKQWTDIESTPKSLLFTAHMPLWDDHVVIGAQLYNQTLRETKSTCFNATLGYRVNVTKTTWLGLAVNPGFAIRAHHWEDLLLQHKGDPVFAERNTEMTPTLGFGATFYGKYFFAGANIVSLFVTDDFDLRDESIIGLFKPGDATLMFTGGAKVKFPFDISLMPSALVMLDKKYKVTAGTKIKHEEVTDEVTGDTYEDSFLRPAYSSLHTSGYNTRIDVTATAAWREQVGAWMAYRTTKELIFGAYYQINPRLRVAYNYEVTVGDMRGYNKGSHEISLQYDLVYKTKNVPARFF